MKHFIYTLKWHIGNVFNKPPRQNTPTDRVLTSVILKGIEWAFRKVYPTKIPGMVHQGLLAPQSLRGGGGDCFNWFNEIPTSSSPSSVDIQNRVSGSVFMMPQLTHESSRY